MSQRRKKKRGSGGDQDNNGLWPTQGRCQITCTRRWIKKNKKKYKFLYNLAFASVCSQLENHSWVVTKICTYFWKGTISHRGSFFLDTTHHFEQQLSLIWKSRWLIWQQTPSERVLIFAFLGILLHTAEEKNRRHPAWHVRDKYLTGNKHLKTHERKKKNSHISDNDVPRKFFHTFTAEEQRGERKTLWGGRKKHEQVRQTKQSHFDENYAA